YIDSWSWTVRLQKHQVIYDPSIDQSTITDMPLVDSIILDNATHGNMTLASTPESHPLGTTSKQSNWARENRQMTCNRDGTQTIFSVARDTKDSENYNIFVLTDDDNGFSVELYDVFYKSETLESNTAETINYTGTGTLDNTVEYQCQGGSYLSTGNTTRDLTASESYNSNSITTGIDYELEFMGAAFNKFTDEIIVAVMRTVNGQYDGDISGMPMETTTTWSKDITNNCTDGDNVSSTNSGSHSHNSSSHTIDALQTTLLINNIPLDSMVLPYYHHVETLSGEGGDDIGDCPN
ncbi:MAG: hypothetical protein GY829_09075, partial [Gammaproteobacteria bacterium]|nr:hypothetical protein [Gammaproteobacteria bacterium]